MTKTTVLAIVLVLIVGGVLGSWRLQRVQEHNERMSQNQVEQESASENEPPTESEVPELPETIVEDSNSETTPEVYTLANNPDITPEAWAAANYTYTPDGPIDTSGIELQTTYEENGMTIETYRNLNRTCGESGYQTFIIASPAGVDSDDTQPLWVRMRGAGGGHFKSNGTYSGGGYEIREQTDFVVDVLDEEGLMTNVLASDADFRVLSISQCDHDAYSGVGKVDPFNPNSPDQNGEQRKNDGLLHVREALAYTTDKHETSHVIAQGTSSGSIGVMSLAISLGKEGKRLSGIVADAGVLSPYFTKITALGCSKAGNVDMAAVLNKAGTYLTDESHLPHIAVAQGIMTTPVYGLYSSNDPQACGNEVVTITTEGGEPLMGQGQALNHSLITAAIEAFNPGGVSVWESVCVTNPLSPDTSACGTHGPTKFGAEVYGDTSRGNEDFNAVIMEWAEARLADPLPTL